jgi:hypothetical protein
MTEQLNVENEYITPCVICGKIWQRKDIDNWVYHSSKGTVCTHHHGVTKWYSELIAKEMEELNNDNQIH